MAKTKARSNKATTKKRTSTTRTETSHSARTIVAQAYWNADQEHKRAGIRRDHCRDLALVAIPPGETAGPARMMTACRTI